MKRLFAITVVMLLSSAMFFVVVCAGAGPVTKPFQAMWTGTLYVVGLCTDPVWKPPGGAVPPYLQVINVAKGVSTLAGKSDFISSFCEACTDPTTTPPYHCNTMEGSGWGIMTAANGDALHVLITVTADLSTTPPSWTEHETVVGGTGKFKDVIPGTTSDSEGTWTSGTNLFPCEPITNPPYFQCIHPGLLQPPQGWVGTTEGWIKY